MKLKSILLVVLIVVLLLVGINIYVNYRDNKIFYNEKKQVEMLDKLYSDFLNDVDYSYLGLNMDESCFRNIITHEFFSEDEQQLLKKYEVNNNSSSYVLTVYPLTNQKTIKLVIEKRSEEEYGDYKKEQKYKLKIKDNEIVYEPVGEIIITVS